MNKLKVSVGIPAYNESKNIINLLNSIASQKGQSFILEKILVSNDGSTDGIDRLVKAFGDTDQRVVLLSHVERQGKKNRLIELYQENTSDLLIVCDGDILLSGPDVIEKITSVFLSSGSSMVCGNPQPTQATTLFQKVINFWEEIWYKMKVNKAGRNNVHNANGCIIGLSGSFAKSIQFPENIISESQYIYFLAKSRNLTFSFVPEAIVYYRKPSTMKDYMIQMSRYDAEKQKIVNIFGDSIEEDYTISRTQKFHTLWKSFVKDPLFTCLSLAFIIASPFWKITKSKKDRADIWDIVPSTKEGIHP